MFVIIKTDERDVRGKLMIADEMKVDKLQTAKKIQSLMEKMEIQFRLYHNGQGYSRVQLEMLCLI